MTSSCLVVPDRLGYIGVGRELRLIYSGIATAFNWGSRDRES